MVYLFHDVIIMKNSFHKAVINLMVSTPLLEIKDLSIHFDTFYGVVKAVRNVSLHIDKGEVLGLVGESGCGKSITARSILGLLKSPPAILPSGEIRYRGDTIFPASMEKVRSIRGREISMIFQEPMTSLNPVIRIGKQVSEAMEIHGLDGGNARDKVINLFKAVGIPEPEKRLKVYPHQLSGGLRQRVMIAMALACNPGLLIADEPTTALDVTIQAQILDLILKMRDERKMAVLMITHDLGVISEVADRVNVMYAGKIVEEAPVRDLLGHALHPYTSGLINSLPDVELSHSKTNRLNTLKGVVPDLYEVPTGCPFSNRCDRVMERCTNEEPVLQDVETGHRVACWLYEQR